MLCLQSYSGKLFDIVIPRITNKSGIFNSRIMKAKAIFMCLDTNLKGASCQEHLSSGNAECIITDSSHFFAFENWDLKKKSTLFKYFTPITFLTKQNQKVRARIAYPEKYRIAYVALTSGSTGTPKVVNVPHSCILPNINDLR